jgi:DNA-binding GntR family transcriptional regulator
VDGQVAAEKTADLVERQLVPGILRACQLLEQANETMAALGSAPVRLAAAPTANEACIKAIEAVRDAVRREAWDQARQLAVAVTNRFHDVPEAKAVPAYVESSVNKKLLVLREQLGQFEQSCDCEGMLNVRDRLSGILNGTELYQVDRRVAHWVAKYLRESLAAGKAGDVIHLAERATDVVGESTPEGAQIRATLATMRRSAGLCPECGQPSDTRLARCPECERKLPMTKAASTKAVTRPGS